ncbi:uncharacterized protein VTP21DRAFT_2797 [Calcarisporiella thermophila]|uniref:uncharacterized protein n=1 Tax=Calcarisporiella thermophila TaxID=911321 RepID=UPI0037440610
MAERILELLDNVELRIALADSDEQFEKALGTYLCPVLRELRRPEESVRRKSLEILSHIGKRVRSRQAVKLPVEELVALISDSTMPAVVGNVAMMYLGMGFERISVEDRLDYLPKLVANIAERPAHQQTSLLRIVLPVLKEIKRDPIVPSPDPYNFTEKPEDAVCLLGIFTEVMLYHPPAPERKSTPGESSAEKKPHIPSGMSPNSVKSITDDGKASWTTNIQELRSIKLGILRFISNSSLLPDDLPDSVIIKRFCILLIGACDPSHEVLDLAEDGLKRLKKPDLEDKKTVEELYKLYQGSLFGKPNPQAAQSIPASVFRTPASPPLKHRILMYLSKSRTATNTMPAMVQVAFDCLYGAETTPKLRNQGMHFVQWSARMANSEIIRPIANVLVSGMLKFIEEQREMTGNDAETLRGFGYVAIGLITKRVPDMFRTDIPLLSNLFSSVSTETANVRVSVQEALSLMIDVYKDFTEQVSQEDISQVESILEDNIDKNVHQARYSAVKYATSLFPFTHSMARYLCLLASADEKLEVRELALEGLSFPAVVNEQTIPNFEELVSLIRSKSPTRLERISELLQQRPSMGRKYVMGYESGVMRNILVFLWKLIVANADARAFMDAGSGEIESSGRRREELEWLELVPRSRPHVKLWIARRWMQEDGGGIKSFLELVDKALMAEHAGDFLQSVSAGCLLELMSLGPEGVCERYFGQVDWFKSRLNSTKQEARHFMSHILGLVATSQLPQNSARINALEALLRELFDLLTSPSTARATEHRHGATLAMGFLIGRLTYRYPNEQFVPRELLENIVQQFSQLLGSSMNMLVSAACIALAEAGRYGPLPQPDGDANRERIVDPLIGLVKRARDSKVQEHALIALGHIAVGDSSFTSKVLELIYSLPSLVSKQVEVLFTAGEILACVAAGWKCSNMEAHLDVSGAPNPADRVGREKGDEVMEEVMHKLLNEMLPTNSPASRKAVCVWLLGLVRLCDTHPIMRKELIRIHEAFTILLGNKDDFVQEAASKGIGLVYELGDATVRKHMVDSLAGILGDRANRKTTALSGVTPDTELFDASTLGSAPDGSSLTTYRSLLSLASDMNQPELVVKFMQLANHNALWQSRAGAAFGVTAIVAQAEEELRPYLADLIPRLYRYQYDPDPKVNAAMTNIWRVLVKEPKKAVDEHFEAIMRGLLEGMGSREWRVRESCCSGTTDLLHGRSMSQLEPYLEDLWNMSFRALDDQKESVRTAAFKTCRALTNMTVRFADSGVSNPADGQRMLGIVIPFLLKRGLVSDAEDVQRFSLNVIIKLCKRGGTVLRPWVGEIVGTLLEGMSSFEPQIMNYLSFHVERYDISREQLETSRLTAAKMSPLMEGIESCIDLVDEGTMVSMRDHLLNVIRKGIGLPSKAACARFLVSVCIRRPEAVRSSADMLLKAISGAILDTSPAVRKSYATAAGYVAHLCGDRSIERFIAHLKGIYIGNEDEQLRSIPGITVLEMTKHASDQLKRFQSTLLPFVFFGTHDANESIQSHWKDAWEDSISSTSGSIKLYLAEIMDFLFELFDANSWITKRQAAVTLADVAEIIGKDIAPYMDRVLPMLVSNLSGRVWEGKEAVLSALCNVAVSYPEYFKDHQEKLNEVGKVLLRECKKRNLKYKRQAIDSLARFGDTFSSPAYDLYAEAAPLLFDILDSLSDDTMDIDDEADDTERKPLLNLLTTNVVKALGMCYTRKSDQQREHLLSLVQRLAGAMKDGVWMVRSGVLEALKKVAERTDEAVFDEENTREIVGIVKDGIEDTKYSAIRTLAFEILCLLSERAQGSLNLNFSALLSGSLIGAFRIAQQQGPRIVGGQERAAEHIKALEKFGPKHH